LKIFICVERQALWQKSSSVQSGSRPRKNLYLCRAAAALAKASIYVERSRPHGSRAIYRKQPGKTIYGQRARIRAHWQLSPAPRRRHLRRRQIPVFPASEVKKPAAGFG